MSIVVLIVVIVLDVGNQLTDGLVVPKGLEAFLRAVIGGPTAGKLTDKELSVTVGAVARATIRRATDVSSIDIIDIKTSLDGKRMIFWAFGDHQRSMQVRDNILYGDRGHVVCKSTIGNVSKGIEQFVM